MSDFDGDPGAIRTRDFQLRRLDRGNGVLRAKTGTYTYLKNRLLTSLIPPGSPLGREVSGRQRTQIIRCYSLPYSIRFWVRVLERPNGCWEWVGNTDRDGYGRPRKGNVRICAHRFAWEQRHGPIPEGQCVLHRCDNPPCVNPDHLALGTQRENMADRGSKGRTVVPVREGGRWTGKHRRVAS